jgi:hypothetical protein
VVTSTLFTYQEEIDGGGTLVDKNADIMDKAI